MRQADRMRRGLLTWVTALVLGLGICAGGLGMAAFVSHAQSQAKVTTANGAKIRKEASTSSELVGGAEKGKVLTVISQVQGSDGMTWYQVKSGEITGFVRSDLVEMMGESPAESGEAGESTPATEVTAMEPMGAVVSGDSGKIRDSASSEGQILAEVPLETALTVTGQALDADGRTWYQVSYLSGETTIEGFIRYDYLTLTETPPTPEEPEAPAPTPEAKLYDTVLQDGVWLLVDRSGEEPKGYSVQDLFSGVKNNGELFQESEKTVKNQKIIIIVLVFLLVAAAAGIAFLVYKVRDLMDSAYFSEVERETIRKKRTSSGGSRSGSASGQDRAGARPSGARTSGYSQGAKPSGSAQTQRPAGSAQRPAGTAQGQRPVGQPQGEKSASQGQRPVRTAQAPAGTQGPKLMGTGQPPAAGSGQRAAEPRQEGRRSSGASQRPAGGGQGRKPVGAPQSQRLAPDGGQKSQPKNFMVEDGDDFDYSIVEGEEE